MMWQAWIRLQWHVIWACPCQQNGRSQEYRKNSLKVACHYTRDMGYSGNATVQRGTHLTRLVLHAILSDSGPIRACHYNRDNPLSTYTVTVLLPLPSPPGSFTILFCFRDRPIFKFQLLQPTLHLPSTFRPSTVHPVDQVTATVNKGTVIVAWK